MAAAHRAQRLTRIGILGLVSLMLAALLLPLVGSTAAAQSSAWSAAFTGKPAAPTSFSPTDWDLQIHSRDTDTWKTLEAIDAHHGGTCAGHPATHTVTAYADAVFQCNDHVMTAINAGGYGLVSMTPNQMVDFRDGEAVVRFDLSTFRSSERDFVSVWVTPFDDQIPLPLTDWLPDLVGEPRNAVHMQMESFSGTTVFKGDVIKNFAATNITTDWWTGYETFLTPSAVRRDTFELRISRTSVKFGMPAYNRWWVDSTVSDLGWTRGVVQLQHHSYNPAKACDFDGTCGPNTWHWDNVSISNAVPFTILKADLPYVDATSRPYVTLAQPAPAGSFLRFSGIGNSLQVSFDGGQTWQNAQQHAVEKSADEHFRPFWMPVPAGTTRVDFRGSSWWGGGWMARGIAVWSENTAAGTPATTTPTPAATATTTATSTVTTTATAITTATATAPTSTATVLPTTTTTPVPTNTATAVPTSTATTPPATSTALPTNTATPAPTSTPTSPPATSTVVPTATSLPATYTTGATLAQATVEPGGTASITAAVTSSAAATVLVDVEVYGPTGAKVHQQFFDNQQFAAGQQRTFPVSWSVPANAATGQYTVKVGVFSAGWGTAYAWNDRAATLMVATGASALPPPTSACSPRPQTTIQTRLLSGNRMEATVQVGRPAGASRNIIRNITFGDIINAEVTVLGQTLDAQDDGASVTPTTPIQTTTLVISRQASRNRQPVTVPLTITDDCGDWQTFIGGGAVSFGG